MKACSVKGCARRHYAKGWCKLHYQRVRDGGEPGGNERLVRLPGPCIIDGCGKPAKCRGWCLNHYMNWLKRGNPRSRSERGEPTSHCVGCHHPERQALDLAILSEGVTPRVLQRFGLTPIQGGRHRLCISAPSVNVIRCLVCTHPDVEELDAILRTRRRGSLKEVSERVGCVTARYHRDHHLDNPVQAAKIAAFHIARLAVLHKVLADESG